MKSMTKEERQKAIDEIKEICRDLGCTKVSSMCDEKPFLCSIIAKVVCARSKGEKVV